MRIFVYEFVTGGGWWSIDAGQPPNGSLLREGAAMANALADDFGRIGDVRTLRDVRIENECVAGRALNVVGASEERDRFEALVRWADATVVIAPEFDRHLLTRSEWVERAGGKLLSPDSRFVALAADKQATAERLAALRIPVPRGDLVSAGAGPPTGFRFPAVLKPRDGAGSVGVRRVTDWDEARFAMERGKEYRLEEFQTGQAASVAVIAGPGGRHILPACRQTLSADGRFQYLGGETPLAEPLNRRAAALARAVSDSFPPTIGYFGIDLVLGGNESGWGDCVIEVNPRLTTSYLGLRRRARGNLAEAMWRIAQGEWTELSFDSEPLQFDTSYSPEREI
jgi:predicted ATP-grasp superfamily ATP-dependent carboligase